MKRPFAPFTIRPRAAEAAAKATTPVRPMKEPDGHRGILPRAVVRFTQLKRAPLAKATATLKVLGRQAGRIVV